ncbi:MAG TPA: AI-2E family transporter [Actinomycetes bacterium]|nr:AI-2E family transporter [Actinomycetes bacterium]
MNGEAEPERATEASASSDATSPAQDLQAPARDAVLPPAPSKPDRVQSRVRPGALYRWGFFAGLGLLSSVGAAMVVYSVRDILLRVVVAVFLAVSLDPAVRWLTARGMRRGLAVTIIFTVFLAILAAFLMSVIPPLVNQFGQLVRHFPDFLQSLQDRSAQFRELNSRFQLSSRIQDVLGQLPARVTGGVLGVTSQVFGALVSFLTVVVFTVYFLLDLPRLRHGVVRLFPVDRRQRYGRVVDIMVTKVGDYMIGRLAIGFIAGLVAFAALSLLGVPYPLPLAIFIALLDLIPLIGHPIGSVAALVVALITKDLWPTTVLLGIVFLVYQQIENYFIGPRVLRHSVDISAAAVLLAALIGAAILGVVGALIAIPVAAALKVVLVQQIDQHEATAATEMPRPHLPRRRRHDPDPAAPVESVPADTATQDPDQPGAATSAIEPGAPRNAERPAPAASPQNAERR